MACRSLTSHWVRTPCNPCLLLAVLGMTSLPGSSQAAEVQTRDFRVIVDGTVAGAAHMHFNRGDDDVTTVSCDTNVRITFLFVGYTYEYRGREVWKAGKLQSFSSTCTDDGKHFQVNATAENQTLRFRIMADGQQEERVVPGEAWLSSYWQQPDA